ncbi:MAG: immunoglobulin domain-containing protein [Bacteroidetes bacterium]|nr:immunoglobulin domain-containing protein [Bacteroidota bacterium]
MRLKGIHIILLSVLSNVIIGQTSLPVSRTEAWTTTPLGWIDNGTGSYTSSQCTGVNSGQLNSTGDYFEVSFTGVPDQLIYTLKGQGYTSGTFTVQEFYGGSYQNIITYSNSTDMPGSCTVHTHTLNAGTSKVKFNFITKVTGNITLDEVSITAPACTPPSTPSSPTAASNPSCGATTLNTMTPSAGETWYWQGTNASGTSTTNPTSSTYPVSVSGTYHVRAQNNTTLCWSTVSASIAMTINASPTISSHPSNTTVSVGSNATFTVTAAGGGLTYQWQEDQGGGFVNLSDGGIYSGTGTSSLTLSGVTLAMDTWQYQCIVTGVCAPPTITSNVASLSIVTTSVGDYRSRANGNWGTNTTWEKWNGSAWVACTAGDFPDAGTSNVEIRTHTIDLDGSGTPPFDCKNLVVQTGGILWTNHFTGANAYVQIYGNITCNGTIGTVTGDDICFDLAGGITCTISGSGSFYATRIRKDDAINNSSNTTLTIDMNIFLFWSTGSATILFNDGSSDAMFDVIVNAGKTLRGITAGAVSNNISIDGVAGVDATACGGSFTVYGTIDIDGTIYITTNNVNLSRPVSLTIKNGGIVKCAYITTSASGVATAILTIESGGKLTLSGADASSNAFSSFSTTNNIYNLNVGSAVEYSGTAAQNVESQLTYSNILFNGGGMKTLNGATTINGLATFTNGLVASTATNILNMSSSSSTTGANNTSFVTGPVAKNGATDFIFPVGKDAAYRPISVTSLSGSETFTAEYFHADPDLAPYDVTLKDATLDDIGRCEYWILNRLGSIDANVTLSWDTYSCGVTSLPDLAIARWDGSMWKDHGNGGTTGTTTNGTIITSGAVTSFSPFTLASRLAGVNPLPIELLNFTAAFNSKNNVEIKWVTSSETNNDYFTIERSADGFSFEEIDVIDGAGNSTVTINYSTIDYAPLSGVSYYRLKQADFDGAVTYSQIISVEKSSSDFDLVYTFASESELTLFFNCESTCIVSFDLFDLMGKKVVSKTNVSIAENSKISIPTDNLSKGIYLIKASDGKKLVSKKIKL